MLMEPKDFVYEAVPHKNNTKLCNACSSGDFDQIDDLIFDGYNINKPNKNGYTPLMCVFDDGNQNNDGYNWNRNIRNKLAYFLLQNGADTSLVTPNGENILNIAVKSQFNVSPKLIEECVFSGADVDNRDADGRTPLMNAIAGNMKTSYYEVINTLIGNGAELDAKDNQGKTPLMYALENHKFIVAEKLIEFGADLHETDNAGNTVLMYAMNIMADLDECVVDRILMADNVNAVNTAGQTAAHLAAQSGLIKITDKLVSAGADIYAKDTFGRTPLMYALSHQKYDMAKFLIDFGASCDDADYENNTVLMYAVHPSLEKNFSLMNDLVSISTNINETNQNGHTVLDMAVSSQCVSLVHQLIQNGADIDSGRLLNSAVENGDLPCILEVFRETLKKHSTYPEQMDNATLLNCRHVGLKGGTLLLTAIMSDKVDLVENLLNLEADADLICYNKSPLEAAVQMNNVKMVDVLLRAGADVAQTNEDGNTPLMVALAENKSKQVIARLLSADKNIHRKNKKGVSARKMLFQRKDKDLLRLVSKQLTLLQKTRVCLISDNHRQNG